MATIIKYYLNKFQNYPECSIKWAEGWAHNQGLETPHAKQLFKAIEERYYTHPS